MANKAIRGITIEIGGDTTKLGKAIEDSEKQTRSLQSELRQVEKLLEFDPGNTELLAQKQKILADAVESTTDKLETLRKAEEQVVEQFNKGDIGEDQLRAFQREIIKTQSELDDFEGKLKGTGDSVKDLGDSAAQGSEGFTIMKGALADLVSSAITSAVSAIGDLLGSLMELSEATEEYRTMQAKLSGSAETFGYSADFAKGKYEEFYKYLNDDQAATNAITNLMGIGTSTENISALAEGATGVWASYGDSIPIESLTEAINETVNAGKVTGTFADTINWCKDSNEQLKAALGGNTDASRAFNQAIADGETAEDAFNAALAEMTSNQERADVVAKFLNSTYGESKQKYDELNSSVTEANEAELALKDTQAELGATMEPVNTALTNLKNQALEAITPLVEKLAQAFLNLLNWMKEHPVAMQIVTAVVIALATAFGVLAGALAIQGLIAGVTKAIAFLNTTLLANPIVLIVAAIAGLVAAFIYLWNNCEGFRNFWINLWDGIKNAFSVAWDHITVFFTETIPNAWSGFLSFCSTFIDNIVNFFSLLPGRIWTWLVNIVTQIAAWGTNLYNSAVTAAKNAIDGIVNFFQQLPHKIAYALGFVLGKLILFGANMLNWAKTNIPKIISSIVDFFSGLPGKIWTFLVNVVTRVATWAVNMKAKAVQAGSNFISAVISFLTQLPGKAWNLLVTVVTKVSTWVVNMVAKAKEVGTKFVTAVITFIKELPGKIWTFLVNAVSKIVEWGVNLANKGKEAGKNLLDAIVNKVKEIPGKMKSIGRDIVEGVWNGIKNATSWIKKKVADFASDILDGMKDALGINSPSKLFRDQVGKFIPEGISVGIADNASSPLKALRNLADTMAEEDINLGTATLDRRLSSTFKAEPVTGASGGQSLLNKLDQIYDRLDRLQIILDTGTLVGETIDKIDAGLASRQLLSARGV